MGSSRKPGGRRFNVGRLSTATDRGTLRDALAEFLATAIFVFAAEGSTLSLLLLHHAHGNNAGNNKQGQGLVAVALAHALALAGAVASTVNISGGHVNPAITFGALLAGDVCLVRSAVYWTAQLLGAVAASLLLRITTGGAHLPDHALAAGVEGWHAVALEAAMAFALMYAYYATAIDPRRTPRRWARLPCHRHGPPRRRQRAGMRPVRRRGHEPGPGLRAGRRGLPPLAQPVGLLGRAFRRRWTCRTRLRAPRRHPARPHPEATANFHLVTSYLLCLLPNLITSLPVVKCCMASSAMLEFVSSCSVRMCV
ncbi:hypothetical protein PR202_ga27340 [Eleusine coracana subsp. coracana]|uniref:Uncharacterized protein n=1 Tax=Eleusine coracana subsp. coracana TaxID=191504 RepID=A0AAV5DHE2_ELECO|nr:hypothetical protein PR202_ga27340 [Eleusine coracana subsp. coracana]